jgi:hypothetical protein
MRMRNRCALGLVAGLMAISACSGDDEPQADAPQTEMTLPAATPGNDAPAGVELFGPLSNDHVTGPVEYPQQPPVGGPHSPPPNWQNCKWYDKPVPNEHAVHSMEHGAVWVTYTPDLSDGDIGLLATLAGPRVLVSPYEGLPSPIVVSSWGRQLRVESVTDVALVDFIEAFVDSPDAPEPGAPCDGGTDELTLQS